MNLLTTSSSSTRTQIEQHIDRINPPVNSQDTIWIILLAVLLPTLILVVVITSVVFIYRRRHSSVWLTKLENSSRLQAIVVNLSPTLIGTRRSDKEFCLPHLKFSQPRTTTIVYNHMSTRSTPSVYSLFKIPIKGENNTAFDESSLKNEQQPILNSKSSTERSITTLETEFPASLQAPVPSITSTFVEAIASHRLILHSNINTTPMETSVSTNTSGDSRESNPSQTVLLFSQRTEF